MEKRTLIKIAVAIIGLLIIAVGIYAYREFTRTNVATVDRKSDFIITADKLLEESISNNNVNAYTGKTIEVTGILKSLEDNSRSVILFLGDPKSPSSVRCLVDSPLEQVQRIQLGEQVTVKGNCTGLEEDPLLGTDLVLNYCIILKP